MRADMNKVLVERPRRGARFKAARMRTNDPEALPRQMGMRRYSAFVGGGTKYPNEHLGPLRRYLWRQRGRPWNKVHGEIRAVLDVRNEVQAHILTHLRDFIVSKVVVDRQGRWWRQNFCHPLAQPGAWPDLYVDPFDGIIKETAKLRRKLGLRKPAGRTASDDRPSEDTDIRQIGPDTVLLRQSGIWYRCRLGGPVDPAERAHRQSPGADRTSPGPSDEDGPWLTFTARDPRWRWKECRTIRRIIDKKQLSGAELRQHSVKNRAA